MKPGEIVGFLDESAVGGPPNVHPWDYKTNVEQIIVDHKRKRFTFTTDQVTNLEMLLAGDVLTLAAQAGMPDTYWASDERVTRARKVFGWSVEQARTWAEERTT